MSNHELQTPSMRTRSFMNLDAALDFAKFVEPYFMSVEKQLAPEGARFVMQYQTVESEL